jgi:hypothetical protein
MNLFRALMAFSAAAFAADGKRSFIDVETNDPRANGKFMN